MDIFTYPLVNVEKKMLVLKNNYMLSIYNIKVHRAVFHNSNMSHGMSHVALPINNPYFKRQIPTQRPQHKRTTKQPLTQSAPSPQLSAPVLPSTNLDRQLSHSHGHSHSCQQDHSSAHPPDASSSHSLHSPLSHPPAHPSTHHLDHPLDDSLNPEPKDLPHSIAFNHSKTESIRSKRARHSSINTELCNVMIPLLFEPRLKKS